MQGNQYVCLNSLTTTLQMGLYMRINTKLIAKGLPPRHLALQHNHVKGIERTRNAVVMLSYNWSSKLASYHHNMHGHQCSFTQADMNNARRTGSGEADAVTTRVVGALALVPRRKLSEVEVP